MNSCSGLHHSIHAQNPFVDSIIPCYAAPQNSSALYEYFQKKNRLTTQDRLSMGSRQPLRLRLKVGIFPDFQIEFLSDDAK